MIVTGTIGDHGMAVMAVRHELELEGDLRSDVAPLNGLVRAALDAGGEAVVAMKDPTRGGLASVAPRDGRQERRRHRHRGARRVPVPRRGARGGASCSASIRCIVANEGKAVIGVRPEAAERVLAALRAHPLGASGASSAPRSLRAPGAVILDTGFGRRLLAGAGGRAAAADLLSMHEYSIVEALLDRVQQRGAAPERAPPSTGCGCASASCPASRSSSCRRRTRRAARARSARTRRSK